MDWFRVRAVDHSINVSDNGWIPVDTSDYSTGLIIQMSAGARICTGIDTGPVRVQASTHNARPQLPTGMNDAWSEIVEASVFSPQGNLRVDSPADGPIPGLPTLSSSGPGWYRMRVCARGRDTAFDQVREEPVEDYLLMAWPEDPSPAVILQSKDQCGLGLRASASTTTPTLAPPEAEHAAAVAAQQDHRAALRRRLQDAFAPSDRPSAAEFNKTSPTTLQEPAAPPANWRPGR
nr:hypothetical protein KitaXyl93_22850 [Kitasatospora sp. Xyl93]